MKTRILAGIVMVFAVIAILVAGELTLGVGMALVSLVAIWEGSRAIGVLNKDKGLFGINLIFCVAINIVNILIVSKHIDIVAFSEYYLPVGIAFIVMSLMYLVVRFGDTSFEIVAKNIFFMLYIVIFFSFVVLIRQGEKGEALIWLVLLTPWATDTLAYFTGVFMGKHKLIEKVSPKKTVEGSIGGIVGCVLMAVIYGCVTKSMGYTPDFMRLIIFCAVASVVSQFGDLAASCIKREHGVKDYGNLIPGHGGILDRFDSVLFCAPLLYYFVKYFPIF